ncbi:hypothetical protein GCM10022237_35410 [Nocardioides ginsengisoli]|uniref:DUF4245 family protein n=1 Tax=Nocardioides ginsengisoli TaxID=363868 RepID=A0ABW3W0B2_9ACTN
MSTQQAPQPTEKPGRYNRSFNGLIASMVVTVVALGGLLVFMGFFRNDLVVKPDAINYAGTIADAQQAGLEPVYPMPLPKGWIATGIDIPSPDEPGFMVRLLTDHSRYVGVRQEKASPGALLSRWVDPDTTPIAGYTVPATVAQPLAREWKGYTDGRDKAYVATVGDATVLVYGSASAKELQTIVDALVTTPIVKSTSK